MRIIVTYWGIEGEAARQDCRATAINFDKPEPKLETHIGLITILPPNFSLSNLP
jgi:hypothetical protein